MGTPGLACASHVRRHDCASYCTDNVSCRPEVIVAIATVLGLERNQHGRHISIDETGVRSCSDTSPGVSPCSRGDVVSNEAGVRSCNDTSLKPCNRGQ